MEVRPVSELLSSKVVSGPSFPDTICCLDAYGYAQDIGLGTALAKGYPHKLSLIHSIGGFIHITTCHNVILKIAILLQFLIHLVKVAWQRSNVTKKGDQFGRPLPEGYLQTILALASVESEP